MVAVVCPVCGRTFHVKPYRMERTPALCCSKQCSGVLSVSQRFGAAQHRERRGSLNPNWQGGKIAVVCAVCGKALHRTPYKAAHSAYHFCGMACVGTWKAQHQSGANHVAYRGGHVEYYGPNWGIQKRAARKRDGYKCCHCGKTQKKNGRALDVHHIKPFRTFGYTPDQNDYYLIANDLPNLISLCRNCHKLAEYGSIPIQPRLL